ncbi:oxidoreductase NAD-binding domain-containing protein [Trichodelitschia bisporula]|uniref:NADH-cytochrome b5 reductase n=1 Tax=Trichodelitschia bisporula TaxID=703511 RepID=A0A6G1I104_9PEZI|nr:oxidoreductase NAD-binding domain-containing protein [Trichodelitschia bisporula]
MFARQVFRPAAVLRSHVRRYASDSSQSSGGNSTLYGAGAAAVGGAGLYWYFNRSKPLESGHGPDKSKPESEGQGQPASKTEEQNIPANTNEASKAFRGGDQGFVSLKLDSVEILNHNTKKFRFSLPENDSVAGLHVASALLAKYKGPEMEKPVIRPYTPTSEEDSKGYIEFVVKKYPNGPMSTHLHDMVPGQRLDFKGPIPKYPWAPNKHDHIALIAGGTGITPMYQLIRAIFSNPEDQTKVTLVFGNISEEDILLKRELEDLENTYPRRFRAFYTLDNPPEKWQQGKGFISKELLKTVLPEPKEGEKLKIFVCGPPGMYKAISGPKKSPADQGELGGVLSELGYSKEQVYKF